MISKKLEKIARQYRIDPATLPPVDGKSITVNLAPVIELPITREAAQSELDRLRTEAQAANRRLDNFKKAERDRILAARASRRGQ
jgi:hypothetical protein